MGDNQVSDNKPGEHKVGDNNGAYFDELILKVLYQLGEFQHNQQISHF